MNAYHSRRAVAIPVLLCLAACWWTLSASDQWASPKTIRPQPTRSSRLTPAQKRRVEKLQAALAEVQFRSASVAQARAERGPDATVTVLYRRLTETDQNTADVGVSLPLPLFDRRTGRIEEAAAEASRAQARYDATQNDLIGQLRRAYESLLIYYRQAENYQTNILPKTDRSLELVRAAYEGGDVSILELLDAQRQNNASHAAYLEVLSKLMNTWLEVEYLVQSHPPEATSTP